MELIDYDQIANKIQYNYVKLIDYALDKNRTKRGDMRDKFISKTVDFSARAVIVPDLSLQAHEIIIPKEMFFKLYILEYN